MLLRCGVAVALNEPERNDIISLTANASVLAPELLPYEVGNALSAMVKRRKLERAVALELENVANRIPVRLLSINVHDALNLALKHGIYAYDAYFLRCAQQFACPLLTLDSRMQQVAVKIGIELLER